MTLGPYGCIGRGAQAKDVPEGGGRRHFKEKNGTLDEKPKKKAKKVKKRKDINAAAKKQHDEKGWSR